MNYIIYRKKADKKISSIRKSQENYTLEELKGKAKNWEDPDRYAEINENDLIGEILDHLDKTDQLQEDWKSSIKKEFIEHIERAQYELNDLEHWVNTFEDEKETTK